MTTIMRNARGILLFLLVISLFIAAGKSPALAQDENEPGSFKNVQLQIYPEYDDPRLLVMLEGQIVGATPPARVRFLVPSAAEMYSAGSMDAQRQYSGGPPDRGPSAIPGWDEISYEVTTETFRVEYYDPIIFGQPDKSISYEFRWLYPISELSVVVQEPRKSTNFSVLPAGKTFVDNDGFASQQYNYSNLDDEPPLNFEISYTKTDSRPSLDIAGNNSTVNNGIDSGTFLTIIIIVALGVSIIGGVFWTRKSRPTTRAARRQMARAAGTRRTTGKRPQARFCRQCGQPIEGSYQFCPSCGAKL